MRVAFLGLGIMGSRQAVHLARAGHELTVWNRTAEKARAWADAHGARVAGTPREAAEAADVVITMVVDGDQVAEVVLGDPDGAAHGAAPGTLFVDMTTIAPAQARAIGTALRERGLGSLDAPVTGSSPRAEAGTLTIMCGGEAGDFERARPLLEAMGQLVVHAGPLGHGQAVKLVNNAVAAVNAATLAQALVVAGRLGVDLDALVAVMQAGSGGSAMLDLKAQPMREHDWTTLFKLEHMLKDVRLCLEGAGRRGAVPLRGAGPGPLRGGNGTRPGRRRLRRGARGRRGPGGFSTDLRRELRIADPPAGVRAGSVGNWARPAVSPTLRQSAKTHKYQDNLVIRGLCA